MKPLAPACSTMSFLFLILASLVTKSHIRLVFPMLTSPDCAPNIAPVFKSPQEVSQQTFRDQHLSCYLFALSAQGELKNAVQVTKALRDVINQPSSTQNNLKWPEESW